MSERQQHGEFLGSGSREHDPARVVRESYRARIDTQRALQALRDRTFSSQEQLRLSAVETSSQL